MTVSFPSDTTFVSGLVAQFIVATRPPATTSAKKLDFMFPPTEEQSLSGRT
jgi:hypothetical protein